MQHPAISVQFVSYLAFFLMLIIYQTFPFTITTIFRQKLYLLSNELKHIVYG